MNDYPDYTFNIIIVGIALLEYQGVRLETFLLVPGSILADHNRKTQLHSFSVTNAKTAKSTETSQAKPFWGSVPRGRSQPSLSNPKANHNRQRGTRLFHEFSCYFRVLFLCCRAMHSHYNSTRTLIALALSQEKKGGRTTAVCTIIPLSSLHRVG